MPLSHEQIKNFRSNAILSSGITAFLILVVNMARCTNRGPKCSVLDELAVTGILDGLLLVGIVGVGAINKVHSSHHDQPFHSYSYLGKAAGLLAANVVAGIGLALAYAAHQDSTTVRNVNAGAAVLLVLLICVDAMLAICGSVCSDTNNPQTKALLG